MEIFRSFAGMITAEITSADMAGTLKAINDKNIIIFDVFYRTDLSVQITYYANAHRMLSGILKKRGGNLKIIHRKGVFWTAFYGAKRPVLIFLLVFLTFATVYLPTKNLFFTVSGNQKVSMEEILQKTYDAGLSFGTSRKEINSEELKNRLMQSIPELSWVGVTSSGCTVTISVKEKSDLTDTPEKEGIVSLVADRDGIIQEITVSSGTALCKPGDAVQAGQVLVSPYEDRGLLVKVSQAKGEVSAKTYYTLEAVNPEKSSLRGKIISTEIKYSLIIGKKQINFYKDSGISPAGCVKMYDRFDFTLPGGFTLPAAIVRETCFFYDSTDKLPDDNDWMDSYLLSYLKNSRPTLQVISWESHSDSITDATVLNGYYTCRENIGIYRTEEYIHNGKNNGENRQR